MESDPIIKIRRQWNDDRIAEIPLSKLSKIHWDTNSGGVQARAPQYYLHGYAWCNEIKGEIAHSCMHGKSAHHIKVCIVKKDNLLEVFNLLVEHAGSKPIYTSRKKLK